MTGGVLGMHELLAAKPAFRFLPAVLWNDWNSCPPSTAVPVPLHLFILSLITRQLWHLLLSLVLYPSGYLSFCHSLSQIFIYIVPNACRWSLAVTLSEAHHLCEQSGIFWFIFFPLAMCWTAEPINIWDPLALMVSYSSPHSAGQQLLHIWLKGKACVNAEKLLSLLYIRAW